MRLLAQLLLEERAQAALRLAALLTRCTTLTPREAELVAYDYYGYSRAEAAHALGIQVTSVKVYWTRIYKKVLPATRVAVRLWVDHVLAYAVQRLVGVAAHPAGAPSLATCLTGGRITADGRVLDRDAHPTGFRLGPDRTQLVDARGIIVGIVTATGTVYDLAGVLVAQVQRPAAERYGPAQ